MTGSKSSARLQSIDSALQEYAQSMGVGAINRNIEAELYLSLTKEAIESMNPEQLAEGSFILNQYALFLQKEINIQQRTVNWVKTNIQLLIRPKLGNYSGLYSEREASAIAECDEALELVRLQREAQLKMDTLSFMASKINYMADSLTKLQEVKRYGYRKD